MSEKEFLAHLILLGWVRLFRSDSTESWKNGHNIFQFNRKATGDKEKFVLFLNWYNMESTDAERSRILCSDFESALAEIKWVS